MEMMSLDLLGVLVLRKIPLVLHAFLQWERLNRWSQDGGGGRIFPRWDKLRHRAWPRRLRPLLRSWMREAHSR
jgi:hypothetical protein